MGSASFLKGGMFSLPEVFQCNIVPGLRYLNFSSLVPWTFSYRVMHEFGTRDYPAPQNRRGSDSFMCGIFRYL